MTDDSEREYKQAMLERLGAAKDYLGNVANRAIGRAAWGEAMVEPNQSYAYSYTNTQPAWARYINRALYQAAPLLAGVEFLFPFTTSRQIGGPLLRTRYIEKHPNAGFGIMMALVATEMALWAPTIFLANNLGEAVGLKLATNATVHMSLDAASAVANRIRNHRPSGTTLVI